MIQSVFHLWYSVCSTYDTEFVFSTVLQELCLQTKLLAPVQESIDNFLAKAPEPPPFLVTKSALNILKVTLIV